MELLRKYIRKVISEKLCKRGYNYISKRKKKDFRPGKGKKRSAQGRKPDIISKK